VYCLGTATDRIAARLRKELFDSYMGTDIELYDAEKNGEMVRKNAKIPFFPFFFFQCITRLILGGR
jgi:hypothetical protein